MKVIVGKLPCGHYRIFDEGVEAALVAVNKIANFNAIESLSRHVDAEEVITFLFEKRATVVGIGTIELPGLNGDLNDE